VTDARATQSSTPTPANGTRIASAARPDAVRKVLARVLLLNLIVVAIKVMVGLRTEARRSSVQPSSHRSTCSTTWSAWFS